MNRQPSLLQQVIALPKTLSGSRRHYPSSTRGSLSVSPHPWNQLDHVSLHASFFTASIAQSAATVRAPRRRQFTNDEDPITRYTKLSKARTYCVLFVALITGTAVVPTPAGASDLAAQSPLDVTTLHSIDQCLQDSGEVAHKLSPSGSAGIDVAQGNIAINRQPCVGHTFTVSSYVSNVGTQPATGVSFWIKGTLKIMSGVQGIWLEGEKLPIYSEGISPPSGVIRYCNRLSYPTDMYGNKSVSFRCMDPSRPGVTFLLLEPGQSVRVDVVVKPGSTTIHPQEHYLRIENSPYDWRTDVNNENGARRRFLSIWDSNGNPAGPPQPPQSADFSFSGAAQNTKITTRLTILPQTRVTVLATGDALVGTLRNRSARITYKLTDGTITSVGSYMKKTGPGTAVRDVRRTIGPKGVITSAVRFWPTSLTRSTYLNATSVLPAGTTYRVSAEGSKKVNRVQITKVTSRKVYDAVGSANYRFAAHVDVSATSSSTGVVSLYASTDSGVTLIANGNGASQRRAERAGSARCVLPLKGNANAPRLGVGMTQVGRNVFFDVRRNVKGGSRTVARIALKGATSAIRLSAASLYCTFPPGKIMGVASSTDRAMVLNVRTLLVR